MSAPKHKPSKLFFVTGVSSGIGRAVAEVALGAGHRVVGTVRSETAMAEFEALAPGRAFGTLLDVTDTDAVAPVVLDIETRIGEIDVLVNNAAYTHEGAIEESPLSDLRQQLEVNLLGAVSVIQAVLPFMRERRRGHIINITALGGIVTFPGLGFFNASKFALEGLSEALAKEVKIFGIAVTAVEPGYFRTEWAGRSMVRAPRKIADYDVIIGPVRERRQKNSGRQPGDPIKGARAILTLVESPDPPVHLALGTESVRLIREKICDLKKEIDTWEQVSVATSFD